MSSISEEQLKQLTKQTCSVGCVAGLLVAAAIIGILCSALICYLFWPSFELISRQEKRVGARKRIRERDALREEKAREEEELQE